MSRGFEVVERLSDIKDKIMLPKRSTSKSAGYDFYAIEDVTVEPVVFMVAKSWVSSIIERLKYNGTFNTEPEKILPTLVKTGIKAYMEDDEVLMLYNRSSNPKKMGLILANSVGVVDCDYYGNIDNDGEIGFLFYNIFPLPVKFKSGDKIGQGVFTKFLRTDGDSVTTERVGGYGSTDKSVEDSNVSNEKA